ncbi:hypothetical protein [Leptospira paudalimensis]|uniref:Uncharacterized protein n=1 Tax=Leptospira paudalimensis TaxID=2950024 RepID=A0ABT3MCI7_9LEPT|nr:hypothetical protein [Leptospira paudalimensis]MCW7506097.1 hypothetical protein [Leptospira paudalimensis]
MNDVSNQATSIFATLFLPSEGFFQLPLEDRISMVNMVFGNKIYPSLELRFDRMDYEADHNTKSRILISSLWLGTISIFLSWEVLSFPMMTNLQRQKITLPSGLMEEKQKDYNPVSSNRLAETQGNSLTMVPMNLPKSI